MESFIHELLNMVIRWVHFIAGIMWVGNSMLFNWLDRNLMAPDPSKPRSEGRIWMLHSGGFYDVEKTQLAPNEMPKYLHWFWLQATITWISGFLLLIIVYYSNGGAFLVDANVSSIHPHAATALGIGVIVGAWLLYDLAWRSPLGKTGWPIALLFIGFLIAVVYGLTHVFSGRAAYLHIGAMLGSLMAFNVWFHILPSQRQLVAATKKGEMADKALAWRAKQRSIHNNYMTFPVLFTMISNHFPSTYGTENGWLILLTLIFAGALVRHFMNIRFVNKNWIHGVIFTVVGAFILLFYFMAPRAKAQSSLDRDVPFTEARAIIQQRCISCHSTSPTDPAFAISTGGVHFDTPEQIKQYADRINVRAVISQSMPLANKTGMTAEERAVLGKWIEAGAKTE